MKLLILDRDGTLNRSREDHVASADEWEPLPGALEAVARLNQGGWRVVLATNQSGIGRGLFDMASLNAIHAKMHRQLAQRARAWKRCSSAPMRPKTAAIAANPRQVFLNRWARASAYRLERFRRRAILCAMCRRPLQQVVQPTCCSPGSRSTCATRTGKCPPQQKQPPSKACQKAPRSTWTCPLSLTGCWNSNQWRQPRPD